jgi:hypothetical protein
LSALKTARKSSSVHAHTSRCARGHAALLQTWRECSKTDDV